MTAGPAYTGYLQDQTGSDAASISGATFLVINGPDVNGSPIRRDRSAGCGRMCAEVDGMNITVDRLKFETQDRRNTYATTHVARCDFAGKVSSDDIRSVAANLFRSLSLMKCRWVGVVGPWLHDTEGKSIGFRAMVTKTMRNGGAISWCHDTMHDAFSQLYPAVHGAFCDSGCSQSIQASLHWLLEAEQCSGGIEGAIILQQALLASLGYRGRMLRRDVDAIYAVGAVQSVPWASSS
jgi:hypothetical protein